MGWESFDFRFDIDPSSGLGFGVVRFDLGALYIELVVSCLLLSKKLK